MLAAALLLASTVFLPIEPQLARELTGSYRLAADRIIDIGPLMASIYVQLGDYESAFHWLERAYLITTTESRRFGSIRVSKRCAATHAMSRSSTG